MHGGQTPCGGRENYDCDVVAVRFLSNYTVFCHWDLRILTSAAFLWISQFPKLLEEKSLIHFFQLTRNKQIFLGASLMIILQQHACIFNLIIFLVGAVVVIAIHFILLERGLEL